MRDPDTGNTAALNSPKTGRLWPIAGVVLALLLALLLGMGLVLPLPRLPIPYFGRAFAVFFDVMHGPAFALFAAILVFALHKWTTLQIKAIAIGAWIFMVGGGCLTEIVQSFIGRNANWHDVMANTLGVTAGVLWAVTRTSRSRHIRRRATAVAIFLLCAAAARVPIVLADCLIQQMERPMLASFERPLEMIRWGSHDCKISLVGEHATHGRFAIRMDPGEKKYCGLFGRKLLSDWSDYKTLAFDITVDDGNAHENAHGSAEVEFIVRIQDAVHSRTCDPSDRYERPFLLGPGAHLIKIPLADVSGAPKGRKMDLSRVILLYFMLVNLDRPCVLYIDNVRLE